MLRSSARLDAQAARLHLQDVQEQRACRGQGLDTMAERPAYDDVERARIRRALERYKDQHKIGLPKLQARIADLIGDTGGTLVPLKTLQRFLAGKHRTDDAFVHHCLTYLMSVMPPPPVEEIGAAFARLAFVDEAALANLTGTYHSFTRPVRQTRAVGPAPGMPLAVAGALNRQSGLSAFHADKSASRGATFKLEESEHGTFLRVSVLPAETTGPGTLFEAHTGVFVPSGASQYLLIIPGFLDVRLHMLRAVTEGNVLALEGHGMRTTSALIPTALPMLDEQEPAFEIQLLKAIPGAPDGAAEGVSNT